MEPVRTSRHRLPITGRLWPAFALMSRYASFAMRPERLWACSGMVSVRIPLHIIFVKVIVPISPFGPRTRRSETAFGKGNTLRKDTLFKNLIDIYGSVKKQQWYLCSKIGIWSPWVVSFSKRVVFLLHCYPNASFWWTAQAIQNASFAIRVYTPVTTFVNYSAVISRICRPSNGWRLNRGGPHPAVQAA